MVADGIGKIAKVSGDRNLDAFGAKRKAHGIGGVVRDREAGDVDIADGEAGAGLKQFELRRSIAPVVVPGDGRRGHAGNVNGNAQLAREHLQPGDVIGMLMRDQDRGERVRVVSGGVEAYERFLGGESGVNEETGPLGGNEGAIAGARRRENRYVDDGDPPGGLPITIAFHAVRECESCAAAHYRSEIDDH